MMRRMGPRLGIGGSPLRVCVIGSGPSAFYAVEALQKARHPATGEELAVEVEMLERLPTPFGLVRGGVAPDHQKIKSVSRVYDKIAERSGFSFFGNVTVGRDVLVEELEQRCHMIVWAIGCESDNKLGVPGEELGGVHSATEFVGWYNGHPDFRDRAFDLAGARRVAIVGNGNVAMDVARILLSPPDRLADTDIADHALSALRSSSVREVVLLGRRGPAQAAFSPKEIEEIAAIDGVEVAVAQQDVALDDYSKSWLESQARSAQRSVKFLQECAERGPGQGERRLCCRFLVAPVAFLGQDSRLAGVRLQHARLQPDEHGTPRPAPQDEFSELPVDLVFKAIGYRGRQLPGLPFDPKRGIVPNADGRVTETPGGAARPGHYVVGWAKRGPTGLVGTNSPDSKATVDAMLQDLAAGTLLAGDKAQAQGVAALLQERGIDAVSWQDWRRLDAHEIETGQQRGKARHKEPSIEGLMAAVRALRG